MGTTSVDHTAMLRDLVTSCGALIYVSHVLQGDMIASEPHFRVEAFGSGSRPGCQVDVDRWLVSSGKTQYDPTKRLQKFLRLHDEQYSKLKDCIQAANLFAMHLKSLQVAIAYCVCERETSIP